MNREQALLQATVPEVVNSLGLRPALIPAGALFHQRYHAGDRLSLAQANHGGDGTTSLEEERLPPAPRQDKYAKGEYTSFPRIDPAGPRMGKG